MPVLVRFFFSSRRRHTRSLCDWSSDVCSSDRNAEANRFLHRGVAFQDFVDLARGNLLPSPVDQLLYPTEQPQISAGIEAAHVPGSKPAIGERRSEERRVGKECRYQRATKH